MGGSLKLSSPGIGLGSRMIVVVPLAKAGPLRSPPMPTTAVGYLQSGPSIRASSPLFSEPAVQRRPEAVKILLAEDNAVIREIVTKLLRKMKVRSCLVF